MREHFSDRGRPIRIYDNLFDYDFRCFAYEFAENSLFKIGWADGNIAENRHHRFLHSVYSEDDLARMGILRQIHGTPVEQEIAGYSLEKAILNLSTPSDCNFQHCHVEDKIVLYYVNLHWEDGWHGETLFYDNSLKNIILATPYTPGRVTVFDGRIPHSIRPQSHAAPFFRYTLALVYKK